MKVINNISKRGIYKHLDITDNENLSGAGDLYIVRDLRTKARKEPGEIASNKNLQFEKNEAEKIKNFDKNFYLATDALRDNNKKLPEKIEYDNKIYVKTEIDSKGKDKYECVFDIYQPFSRSTNNLFRGYINFIEVDINIKECINIEHYLGYKYYCYCTIEYFEKLFKTAILTYYDKLLQQRQKFIKDNISVEDVDRKIKYFKIYYSDPSKFDAMDREGKKHFEKAEELAKKYPIKDLFKDSNLGKPTIKFEFENNEELKDFLKENQENLIDSSVEDAEVVEDEPNYKRKSLNGFTSSADIFNVPENCLITKGFKPTYKILADYSHLIEPAENQNILTGYGFNEATLKLLGDACKYYKQVAKLAQHLKGDSEIQSAFNVWHWLHTNIKYAYDTPGTEEIRRPARVWQDRNRGVDCDCLAVFTACLLYNMGYLPRFEIVGFSGQEKYSHIFVNLNGVAVDRVLPIFNQRPQLITKTLIMKIPVFELSGANGLTNDVERLAGLQGIYNKTLCKMFTHTETPDERLNFRKVQVLLHLNSVDPKTYRWACVVMPYVTAIDDDGAYYFRNEKVADLVQRLDREFYIKKKRGDFDGEEGLKGLLSFVDDAWKGIKNAAVSVYDAVVDTAKAVGSSVANATKATVNIVKAGGQLITGNAKGAKETIKKAGQQIVSSVVDPAKQAYNTTVDLTKKTVIEPVVQSVKIAGKLFKVIFITLNPLLVLMRNSLRLLIAINFLGMASRLNLANYDLKTVEANGYTESQWNEAKKAQDRVIRFFTKLGGEKSKIEKSIRNGAKKKAIFGKDYNVNTKIVETGDDSATLSGTKIIKAGINGLGEGATIASCLASVGAFIAKIWGWIKNIVPKVVNWVSNNKELIQTGIDMVKGGKSSSSGSSEDEIIDENVSITTTTTNNGNNIIKYVGIAAAVAGVGWLLLGNSKKRK